MNGTLTSGSHTDSGSGVTFASSIETPVTPPSMKLLESRKPLRPKAAARIPSAISNAFRSFSPHRLSDLTCDDAAGDAIAGVAGRIGLQIVNAGVHDQRGVDAHLHVGRHHRGFRRAVLEHREVVHVAGVRALGILQAVLLALGIEVRRRPR